MMSGLIVLDYSIRPSLKASERGMRVVEHPEHQGCFEIPLGRVRRIPATLHSGKVIVGGEELLCRLREEGRELMDLKFRNRLLSGSHLVPERWKSGHAIYFLGTILGKDSAHNRTISGHPTSRHAPGMVWMGRSWRPTEKALSAGWTAKDFVAVLV